MITLRKTFRFEASHQIPKHPGKCRRLHGHSWVLHVDIRGEVNPETGMVKDYYEISKAISPLVDSLDHQHFGLGEVIVKVGYANKGNSIETITSTGILLNTVENMPKDLVPTSENLLFWIADQLSGFDWYCLSLDETCNVSASLSKKDYLNTRINEASKARQGR